MDGQLLKAQLIGWFEDNAKAHPEWREKGQLVSPFWMETSRFGFTRNWLDTVSLNWKQETPLKELTAKIYQLSQWHPGGIADEATFACYSETNFLWLDDHSSNDGFIKFLARESLPLTNADFLAQVLLATKFSFLLNGRRGVIVTGEADIPWHSAARIEEMMAEYPKMKDDLAQEALKVSQVGRRLYAPRLTHDALGSHLEFCLWTEVCGYIYELTCHFPNESSFYWSGKPIESAVGYYFMPR